MKKIFSKFAGSVAVVALALTVAAPVSALTAADIQLLVSMGVIPADKAAAAMAALGGSSTTSTSCGTYTRDLTLGSTGADVVSLQTYLEAKGHLTIPAGTSKGYFGALTQSALAKYQAAMGISPAAGYFGPMTRAKVSGDCSTTPTTPTTPSTGLSGDEASLEAFDFSSGDDSEVEEGESADVAEIEFDVEDGDVMLDRVDLEFSNASSTDTTDVWDALEMVELVLDGEVIGEADLSDEDEYLDEDDGTVRISGINTKLDEGETVTIVVRVTAQDNVDSDDQDTFEVVVIDDGIRATDSQGIQQYLPTNGDSDAVDFDVEEAGADAELKVSSSQSDPDESTLKVEDDEKSDLHKIFVFDLEAEEDDMDIDTVEITLTTASATASVISDLVLEIDGEEFDDWSYTTSSSTATTLVASFDVDKDYTLDADSEVEVAVWAEFKAANNTNYTSNGVTVQASIADGAIEAEGKDDYISDGVATGEEHTLSVAGVSILKSGFSDEGSSANNDANDSRDFTFSFEVTAFEEDFFINATSGVTIFVEGATTSITTDFSVDSTGDENAGVFEVAEGETETFTVTVTVSGVGVSGQYRVGLDTVIYSENSNGVTGAETFDTNNSDFDTAYRTINA